MRILALETTDKAGSLAVLDGPTVLANLQLNPAQRSAQSLFPGIREILQTVGWTLGDVELLALPTGPGSFTGLRVGVTTVKTLAYATGAAVLGLNTLEVIAAQAESPADRLLAAMDAQRGEVFAGQFDGSQVGRPRWSGAEVIQPAEAWLAALRPGDVVTGPALGKLGARLPGGVKSLPPGLWQPQAATVGHLARQLAETGRRDDLWKLLPHYLRPSAAEEKLTKRGSGDLG